MQSMNTVSVSTPFGERKISVFTCNILDFDEPIDILTVSAFKYAYTPTPRTMFAALDSRGISVEELAHDPEIDLRETSGVWLSREFCSQNPNIARIGCVEFIDLNKNREQFTEKSLLTAIKSYFQMLDIAATAGIKMKTVALPLLGAGNQNISANLSIYPILNECIDFLKRNEAVEHICFIDYNQNNAYRIAKAIDESYAVHKEKLAIETIAANGSKQDSLVFISYNQFDRDVAIELSKMLELRGIKTWYAPRDINVASNYADSIVSAITRCTHFIVIVSRNSINSEHVLNEINLAFNELRRNITYIPLRLDMVSLSPSFEYYLNRRQWKDASVPPLNVRLNELADEVESRM